MAKQKQYTITGKLVDFNNRGLSDLRIEAWDKDLIFDDFIGESTSDEKGNFTITFTDDRFKELFLDKRPDIYFKIYQNNRLILSTEKSVLWNIRKPSIRLEIKIDLKLETSDNIFKQNAKKLKSLPGLKKIKQIKEVDLYLLLTSSIDQKSMILSSWKDNKKISEQETEDLANIIDLLRIANSSIDIISALSTDGIDKTKDLAKYNRDSVIEILKRENLELPTTKSLEDEVDNLLEKAEREYASEFFMYRIMENPQLLDLDDKLYPEPSSAFKSFYNENKDFDLKNEVLISLETGKPNSKIKGLDKPMPELIKEISHAQQALKLSSNSEMAALLFKNQINVRKAVQTTHQSLMRHLGVDASAAIEIKRKAQYYHEAAMNGYLSYKDIISSPFLIDILGNLTPAKKGVLDGIGNKHNWQDIVEQNGLKDINSIEDLFGSQNYCDCEHCKSVLGPAAYFVDLMRFTEKRVLYRKSDNLNVKILEEDHPIHLKMRRPDLWELELTCENTNKRIPYVEIINKVISTFVKKHLGEDKTISQRLLEEQPDLEFLLPYNQHLDEVRTWLSFFELSRLEVMEYLYSEPTTDEKLLLSLETLNLSQEQYEVIIDGQLNASVDKDVLKFRQKSGLSAEETEALIKMNFWEDKISIVQVKDSGDIQKFHLEFSTSLSKWKGKLHRLIRLWRLSGWAIPELDIIFDSQSIKHSNLNKSGILKLAAFKKIITLLGLDVDVIAGILTGIPDSHEDINRLSWKLILPDNWIEDEETTLEDLHSNTKDEAFNLLLRLQGTFGVNSPDLLACLDLLKNKIGTQNAPNNPIKIVFDLNSLNQIYRYIQVYKWTEADSFEQFSSLLKIWGGGSTVRFLDNPIEDIPDLVSFLNSFAGIKISIEDLIMIFDSESAIEEVIESDKQILLGDEIQNLLRSEAFSVGNKYNLFFNKWLSIDLKVLDYYRYFVEISNSELETILSDTGGGSPDDASIITLSKLRVRLEILEFLVDKFKIDFDSLLKMAEVSQECDYVKLGFQTWQDKEWVKELAYLGSWIKETTDLRNFDLWTVLHDVEKEPVLPIDVQKAFVKWKGIDLTQVTEVITQTDSIKELKANLDRIDLGKKLNLSSSLLERLKTDNTISELKDQSEMLKNAIRSKYDDNTTWEEKIQDYSNKVSSNLRDALCNYVVFNSGLRSKDFGFNNLEDLFAYFLLDVGMGDCFTLTRIVAATNSLQVYIHRCLMGFERSGDGSVSVLLDIDEQEEWEWRKNYRVWEANRKIFLYPENYIEPEIRDNKTPEFKELEDELLQQKLNMEVVENAYKKYIQQIMTLAELKVAGAYYDKAYNRIYLFGRTNKQPVEYYYRHVEFLENGGVIWSNWEKMNISIPTEDVSAIRYNGKLYIFWTTYQRKDISDVTVGTQSITKHTFDVYANYSYLQVDNKWIAPQRVEVNYRTSYPFDPYLRIEKFKGMVEQEGNSYKFGDNVDEEDIRENVLKAFEKTVYRKPYPVITDDRNILDLDFIWTDKENALEPRYRYTRGVIDAFTKEIKVKIHLPIIGWHEFNAEFSFDRFDRILHYGTEAQKEKPAKINPTDRSFQFNFGPEKLEFILDFSEDGTEYELRTGNSSGNDWVRFKSNNAEIKSGNVKLYPKIEYVEISVIENERNLIKLADQKLIESEDLNASSSLSFTNEYRSYFDSFTDFYITDGTVDFADGYNDFRIQQRDMVAILTTPSDKDSNDGYKLNPQHIQMLWDKISISLDDLLDNNTQRHVSSQLNYSNSFGNYFYELFFHIPMRIADHLNAAGKYREANQWYSYIYNPAAIKDNFERLAFPTDVNWRFEAFRNISIPKLKEIYSDENAIVTYQRNPGNPHAIARLRIGAYQKNVVMKYLDNLLDWADYLFQQYTPESTSEARHLYNIVKSILGSKPENVGKCKDTKVLTYSDINVNDNSDFIYNLFAVAPPSEDNVSNKPGQAPGYIQFIETNSRYTHLVNSVPGLQLNLKESKWESKTSVKYHSYGKGMKDVAGRVENEELPDKHLGTASKPEVYIDPDIDLIFCFPHNKDFIAYWDRVNEKIYYLNNCMDINGVKKEMATFAPEIDPALLAKMVAGGLSFDEITASLSSQLPNHRFSFLIEKAKQYCGIVQSFGSNLLAAIEKRDGEELTLLRARHEQNILTLTSKTKKNQIEQAKANLSSLLENKANVEQRRDHYANLLEEGLIEWERAEQIAKWTSGSLRATEGVIQLLSAAFHLIPQLGSPFAMKYGGMELGASASRFANASEAIAKIADNVAILAGLEASHQRRAQDWQFQLDTANQELLSMNEQVRSSEIALALAEFDLEVHDKNIEQYEELYEFYTTKFTDYKHYTFQVQQLQKLNRIAFNLANDLAMQAQQAFEFERFGTTVSTGLIKPDNWNSEKLGLLAGDHLMTQLMQMEKEFHDTDKRKMEITQHFSMLQLAPDQLLKLKTDGECDNFTIPEAAFDLIYPGYFRRTIKSIRITIPCITGPYTNIGATLTLGNNKVRKDKDSALTDFNFGGNTMIVTSSAQNDGGQFELNFRDERYLPFEGAGAISTWTLSLPKAKRAFDYNSISDVIFHISYTADYDGTFKTSVEGNLISELNAINSGNGYFRTFSLRHDFPNEWQILSGTTNDSDVNLDLRKEHFPFFANIDEIEGIGTNCYVLSAANDLEAKTGNEGITKADKMKIKIPKAVGKQGYKDVIFFANYSIS